MRGRFFIRLFRGDGVAWNKILRIYGMGLGTELFTGCALFLCWYFNKYEILQLNCTAFLNEFRNADNKNVVCFNKNKLFKACFLVEMLHCRGRICALYREVACEIFHVF